jgi:hypothetical protein
VGLEPPVFGGRELAHGSPDDLPSGQGLHPPFEVLEPELVTDLERARDAGREPERSQDGPRGLTGPVLEHVGARDADGLAQPPEDLVDALDPRGLLEEALGGERERLEHRVAPHRGLR